MDKRLCLVIKPAVHYLQPIHQPRRINAEIRFPVFKLIIIKPRQQTFFIQAAFGQLCKRLFDHTEKLLLLGFLRPLCHDGKIRLARPVVIIAVYVLTDAGIQKRLL